MLKLFLPVLIFISTIQLSAQVPFSIQKASEDVFLSFHQNKSLIVSELESLKAILNTEAEDNDIEKEYSTINGAYDSLINHFTGFEKALDNISSDSALVLFNQWYLHFSNTFYKYSKEKFFSSAKTKILFLSTSMSCHCTMEMCKNQTVDIIKFIKENNDEYDYWVVDTYEYNELQLEYETLFAPSVIVFNTDNQILIKIEYDEMMIDKLNKSLINLN
jgi:hypothetical protein